MLTDLAVANPQRKSFGRWTLDILQDSSRDADEEDERGQEMIHFASTTRVIVIGQVVMS